MHLKFKIMKIYLWIEVQGVKYLLLEHLKVMSRLVFVLNE